MSTDALTFAHAFVSAPHVARRGILLRYAGCRESTLVFGKLSVLISDERAGKDALQYKGASGVKLCMLCATTCMHSSVVMTRGNPEAFGLIPSTETDTGKFSLHTDATINAIAARLRDLAENGSEKQLDDAEKDLGFSYNPEWLLLDANLDVKAISVFMWD